jgi:hypothetical protein
MLTTQLINFNPFKSPTIVGIAVEMTVPSTADMNVDNKIAAVVKPTLVFFAMLLTPRSVFSKTKYTTFSDTHGP